MSRYARGQFNVGYEQRVDRRALCRRRVEKAQAERAAAGLDALLVWKDENVRYLTDLRAQLIAGKTTALNGALLVEGEDPILFCSGGERDRVDRTMPWLREVHTIPIVEQRELIAGCVREILAPSLREHGLAEAAVGVDQASTVLLQELRAALPKLALEDGDTPMQRARTIKLPGEIELLEEATALADAVTA
ncbi:MAG TPA: aminopeptidase P family N-terminal domain-containing protein, partial [Actinomycetota bacterium]|nr:aminopeptidase P family N-terminal domain-containing protein [Actinomycetota bacterium]